MRTPVFLLAGLLAVTVPFAPAQAATCSPYDSGSCVDAVYETVDTATAAAYGAIDTVNNAAGNLCYDGPDTCDDYAVDRVENACGGSTSTCDDAVTDPVNDRLDQACHYQPCDDYLVGYAMDRLEPTLDDVEELCGGSINVNTCKNGALDAAEPVVDLVVGIVTDYAYDRVEQYCGARTATACNDEALAAVNAALGAAGDAVEAVDADGDGVPNALEGELCGRQAIHDQVNGSSPYTGRCVTTMDYVPPASGTYTDLVLAAVDAVVGIVNGEVAYLTEKANDAVGTAVDTATWAVGYAQDTVGDNDHDGVPDDREAFVCSLENQNDPTDGTCDEDGYNPPATV